MSSAVFTHAAPLQDFKAAKGPDIKVAKKALDDARDPIEDQCLKLLRRRIAGK